MGIKPTPFTPYTHEVKKYPWMITVEPYREPKMSWLLDWGWSIIAGCVIIGGILIVYA
jgi:hypothetical protein